VRRSAPAVAAGLLAIVVVAASGCSISEPSPRPPSVAPTAVPTTPSPTAGSEWWRAGEVTGILASGLAAPWSVVPLEGGGALISQRDDGAVLELTADGALRPAGVVPGVVSGGESGLHGLAVLDGEERMLYAYFGSRDDNRVIRMPLLGEPGSLSLGEADVVVSGIPRANTHNGGRLAFGPDGFLYITTGDAQQRDAAQDPDALGGKILRVTPSGDPAPGNPWHNEAYSLGHRNVQGIAWTDDGELWASEFGQNTWDELNRIEPGGNYGWPLVEGVAGREGLIDPVTAWTTSDASPSGIAARGRTVFIAGLRGERLWAVDTADGAAVRDPVASFTGEQGRLRDVVALPDGALWLLTNNTDGRGSPRADDDALLRVDVSPAP
jgi:glucose/arabinose dehydrogenase